MHNLQKDDVVEPVKWGKKNFQSQALPQIWDEKNLMERNLFISFCTIFSYDIFVRYFGMISQ